MHANDNTSVATTITLQRALADGLSPGSLRACADWNERRVSSKRHQIQAAELRRVAAELEAALHMERAA